MEAQATIALKCKVSFECNELTENGYEIESGKIQLTSYFRHSYNTVFLEKNYKLGVSLRIGTELSEENINKIIPWFNGLNRKYESKNQELFT